MFAYRVGFPGWKIAARLGCPLRVKVFVVYDEESKMLVAECNDFQPYLGIVTEGNTFEELQRKVEECCEMAMEEAFRTNSINRSVHPNMTLVGSLP